MAELTWNGRLLEAENALHRDIREMTTLSGEGGAIFLAAGGSGGGLMSVRITESGAARLLHELPHGRGAADIGSFGLSLIDTRAGLVALTGCRGDGTLQGRVIDSDTGRFTEAEVTVEGGLDRALALSLNGVLYAASEDSGLIWHREVPTGAAFDAGAALSGAAADRLGGIVAMAGLTDRAGADLLLTLSREGGGITVFALDPASGAPRLVETLNAENGLGLQDEPLALETVLLGGVAHGVVLSAAANGAGAALSVMAIGEDGHLRITDHILDSHGTRFGHATGLATAQSEGRAYVLAGGADGGLSLFALSPGGRLLHLDTIEQTPGSGLGSISALEMAAVGDSLAILAASETGYGLVQLGYDLSGQGITAFQQSGRLSGTGGDDLLEGGSGANTLIGGAGADMLIDGAGADRLTGGAGRDSFVLVADGAREVITDFTAGEDRIDLSHVPMLYGPDRLTITQRPWGAEISWGSGDSLELRSADGRPLSQAQVLAALDWTVDRPPLILTEVIRGDAGADRLQAPEGGAVLLGFDGPDALRGGAGDDRLEGGEGHDTLHGRGGADMVVGGAGRDLAWLGAGNDTFAAGETESGASDAVHGEAGRDVIAGGAGQDSLWGGEGEDLLQGDAGDDQLFGGAQFDTLQGGAGHDTVDGGLGRDLAWLGQGDDVYLDTAQGGDLGNDTVFGGEGSDRIMGDMGRDLFYGEAGADTIRGGLGNDSLFGGEGNDSLHGGDHHDRLEGGGGNDTLDGAPGNDRIFGGDGHDRILGGEGQDSVHGGNGRDLVFLNQGDDVFHDNAQGGDPGRDTVWAGLGDDTIEGGNGGDLFYGQQGNDLIHGRLGNDLIFGGDQFDTVHAGEGSDTVHGGNGRDLVYLNQGNDVFHDNAQGGDLGRDTVFAGLGDDTIEGGNGDDLFHGEAGADLIHGRLGNDLIFGGDQFDTVHAGEGSDTVHGGNGRDLVFLNQGNDVFHDNAQGGDLGRDTVFAGLGDDTIQGGNGGDLFHGQQGNDLIHGRLGNDSLSGGAGRDTLHGGGGSDRLTGDDGADRFVFVTGQAGTDVVTDFTPGQDLFVLTGETGAGGLTFAYEAAANEVTVSWEGAAMAILQSAEDLSGVDWGDFQIL